MKRSLSNKIIFTLLFAIPIAVVITVFLVALKPWENYEHNGPIAYPKDKLVKIGAPQVKANEGIVFGGLTFQNNTDQSIQIVNIQPSNISSDMQFQVLGVGDLNLTKGIKSADLKADQLENKIHKLPFDIPANSNSYRPIVELTADMQGTYVMDGLIITYKYDNKQYRELYPDQFTLKCIPATEQ